MNDTVDRANERIARVRQKRSGWRLTAGDAFFLAVVFLLIVGALNVFSSTFYMNLRIDGNITGYFFRHLTYIALGLVGGYMLYRVDYRMLRVSRHFWCFVTLALLIMVELSGVTVNGARRWLAFGGVTFQPSEIAKFFGIVWAASELAALRDKKRPVRLWQSLFAALSLAVSGRVAAAREALAEWKPLRWPLFFALFVYLQPDFGTVILILAFPIMLYMVAGLPLLEIVGTVIVAVAAGAVAVVTAPYRLERIIAWYDPFSYARDLGYQVVQSIIAIGSGGIFGQGFGEGHSKFAYLPEQYTDFAYAVYAQEAGFCLAVLVPIALMVMLIGGGKIARASSDRYARYLVYGVTALLVGQGLYNIAMTVGVMPVTGVPLPFISYGGSAMVMNLMAAGAVLGVDRQTKRAAEDAAKRERVRALTGDLRPDRRWEPPR